MRSLGGGAVTRARCGTRGRPLYHMRHCSGEAEGVDGDSANAEAPTPVPALNSYPPASACIYLDFDGETVTGTSWGSNIIAAATGYSASKITDIWKRVAADFEPFNLNVTTEESVYLNAPATTRIRCIITPSNEWYGSSSAGGVAASRRGIRGERNERAPAIRISAVSAQATTA